ncbi:Spore germination protein B3 precursor [compost metagenome]
MTFEITSMKSRIVPRVEGEKITFRVSLETEGHLIEVWNGQAVSSTDDYAEQMAQLIEKKLDRMMQTLIRKLQSDYKTDVAGFGNRLSVEHPAVWKTVKENWDEVFSNVDITFSYDVRVKDFGSFTENED